MLLIALALIFARIFGYLFDRIKQPAVIGEIIAGLVLGALGVWFFSGQTISFFDFDLLIPNLDYNSEEFRVFAELGILFLLFISGLETSMSKLKKMGRCASYTAVGGIVVPFVFGLLVGVLFGFTFSESIVVALVLVATSVGVTVRTLFDLHKLDSDVGATILGSAVIDDVIGIVLLAFFLGVDSPIYVGIKIIIFFLLFLYVGLKIMDRVLSLGERLHLPKSLLSIVLAIFLLYTFFADGFGITGIIGAFVAGLIIGNTMQFRRVIEDVKTIGYSMFIPLFFVWIGAQLWANAPGDVESYSSIGVFAVVIIVVAVVGKIVGCGVGARLSCLSWRESLEVGVGMIPRMELALVIASTAIANDLLLSVEHEHLLLISTVLLTIVTTLVAPVLIKSVFPQ